MAVFEEENDIRNRFQWVWNIDRVRNVRHPEPKGKSKKPQAYPKVPMKKGDRLFLFFVSEYEVCFHRRGKSGFENDEAWEVARGIFNPKTNNITGEIIDEKGNRTVYVISLRIDPKTGRGCISGKHFYNPEVGSWSGGDNF